MTELQLGLVLAGAVLVGGVVVYNKIQERAAARRTERSFGPVRGDALLDAVEERREPVLRSEADLRSESGSRSESDPRGESDIRSEPDLRGEPDLRSEPPAEARTETTLVARQVNEPLPDPRLDYVIELNAAQPLEATALLELWSPLAQRFAPRALLAGVASDDEWRVVADRTNQRYQRIRAGLQLVTRSGAIAEAELTEFRAAVGRMAAELDAASSGPEPTEAMETARELDQLCANTDIQVVIHVVAPPGGALRGTKIRAAAEAAGLVLEHDGRFTLRDAEGRTLYVLGARDGAPFSTQTIKAAALPAISLAMDVPRAPDTRRTFDAMVAFARKLATTLGASLADDDGRALDERGLVAIGRELDSIPKALGAKGFAPGSATALRLFS